MSEFNPGAINFSWPSVLPLIVVSVAAIAVLMVGVSVDDDESLGLGVLSLAGLALAFVLALAALGQSALAFGGSIVLDNFAIYFDLAILISTAMTVLMSLEYVGDLRLPGAE